MVFRDDGGRPSGLELLATRRELAGGRTLAGSVAWETVDKLAVHGSRKIGGSGQRLSSSARLRFLDSMLSYECTGGQVGSIDEGRNKSGSRR